jgi:glycosyltransferase involved in cell wall biosynthesis
VKKKATIGLCLIVKDEEKNIARCIKSVNSFVDEIIVVDTGSTDDTVKIAEELNAAVYYYPWDNSFSNARNFAMGKAKSQWLLLLDADEELDQGSCGKLAEFINTTALDGAHFRVRNYTGSYSRDNYNLHNALRLLRNNGMYTFKGNIHEQICREGADLLYDRFTVLDVVLHHYGYLDDAVHEKQKRKRNIPILEKELEAEPGNAFTLFNMGNEYLSVNDFETALDYYKKAKANIKDVNMAFVPHLYFRMVNCYEGLRQYQAALNLIEEGIGIYSGCTDYEFIRANIHLKCKRYTMAIASLDQCLKMGNPPLSLEFINGCGAFRAAYLLGEIYSQLEDYAKALHYYKLTLSFKPDMFITLYRIGFVLNKMYENKGEVRSQLFSFFADPGYPPNIIVGADIMLGQGLYEETLRALEALPEQEGYDVEFKYLTASAQFFLGQCESACLLLKEVLNNNQMDHRILPGIGASGAKLYFAAGLSLGSAETAENGLEYMKSFCSRHEQDAGLLLYKIFADDPPGALDFENDGAAELEALLQILGILLRLKKFELFEKLLRALNYIDCKDVLLRVARLFWKNGFFDLAVTYVLRSVKELDIIDEIGAQILYQQLADPVKFLQNP